MLALGPTGPQWRCPAEGLASGRMGGQGHVPSDAKQCREVCSGDRCQFMV